MSETQEYHDTNSVAKNPSDTKTKYLFNSKGERIIAYPQAEQLGNFYRVKGVTLLSIRRDEERYLATFSHKLPCDPEENYRTKYSGCLYLTQAKFEELGYDETKLIDLEEMNVFMYSITYHRNLYIFSMEEHKSEDNNCCTLL